MDQLHVVRPGDSGDYGVNTRTRVFATALAAVVGLIAWAMLRMSSGRDPVAWGFVLLAGGPALWFMPAAWTHRSTRARLAFVRLDRSFGC